MKTPSSFRLYICMEEETGELRTRWIGCTRESRGRGDPTDPSPRPQNTLMLIADPGGRNGGGRGGAEWQKGGSGGNNPGSRQKKTPFMRGGGWAGGPSPGFTGWRGGGNGASPADSFLTESAPGALAALLSLPLENFGGGEWALNSADQKIYSGVERSGHTHSFQLWRWRRPLHTGADLGARRCFCTRDEPGWKRGQEGPAQSPVGTGTTMALECGLGTGREVTTRVPSLDSNDPGMLWMSSKQLRTSRGRSGNHGTPGRLRPGRRGRGGRWGTGEGRGGTPSVPVAGRL